MKKRMLLIMAALMLSCVAKLSAQEMQIGFVNFKTCLEKSKQGQQEKAAFEALRVQMQETLEKTDKELSDIAGKLEDQDYMDGLSPTAEEELKLKFQTLSQEFGRYQNQYYQLLNQANYKMFQSLHDVVSLAAEKVRDKKEVALVLNEDSVFAFAPSLDMTEEVISEMDRLFNLENSELSHLGGQ